MKVVTQQTLAFRDTKLVFSKAELAALRKASEIAEQARDLMRETLGQEAEEHPFDLLLAEIEHNPGEMDEDGFVLRSEESLLI